jgi:ribonuclease-3
MNSQFGIAVVMKKFEELEKTIGYKFKKTDLLKEALTHSSYVNENPSWSVPNNERLEFLGDAVLELIVTEELYHMYPDEAEGKLTSMRAALVNYIMLAKIAKEISLEDFILLSRGEAKDKGKARDVILANAYESLVGAVYLDDGYVETKKFIKKSVMPHINEVMEQKLYRDPKSLLQEIIQERLKITPNYKVLGERGPDHKKLFVSGVYFGDKMVAEGEGTSKQESENSAAEAALKVLETD